MRLQGRIVSLRAVEPRDVERLYEWENDVRLWAVSGTTEPFSRAQIEQFVERQMEGADLLRTGQLRLMIDVRHTDGAEENEAGAKEADGANGTSEANGENGTSEANGENGTSEACGAEENEAGGTAGNADGDAAGNADGDTAGNVDGDTVGNVDGDTVGGGAFRTVGAVDLFEYDPLNGRAGLGILIYGEENRRRGYASDTLEILCRYAREQLRLHQLWCTVGAGNAASLALFRQAGFVETGVRRDWLWSPEGFRDEILLQKILDI